jgi:hypothetical protein
MLKGILRDHKFNWNVEIEEAIPSAWNSLAFDGIQSVFPNHMSRVT